MKKGALYFFLISAICLATSTQTVIAKPYNEEIAWRSKDANGEVLVHLYFFWAATCPHCQDARPHIEALPDTLPWLKIHSLEITNNQDNLKKYHAFASTFGLETKSVPTFVVCANMFVGWDSPDGIGQTLIDTAKQCRELGVTPGSLAQVNLVSLPLVGELDINNLSLPLFTLIIAGLDAFNPCAFFILLFLLSLLVHARSRKRMLLVGMTFVFISGLVYFLFMATWLNLFLLVGSMPYITLAAGLLAITIGVLNTREFFFFSQGPHLSIPESARPKLFKRMGALLSTDSLPALLAGTVTLAIAVNSYELLCTAGFPMIYTRILTNNQLSDAAYYLYLAFYNFIYIIPLMVIVGIFTATLGSRKLKQSEGRLLKLLSGIMMLLLGTVLIFAPDMLSKIQTGIGLLTTALLLVLGIWYWKGRNSDP